MFSSLHQDVRFEKSSAAAKLGENSNALNFTRRSFSVPLMTEEPYDVQTRMYKVLTRQTKRYVKWAARVAVAATVD